MSCTQLVEIDLSSAFAKSRFFRIQQKEASNMSALCWLSHDMPHLCLALRQPKECSCENSNRIPTGNVAVRRVRGTVVFSVVLQW